jgi:hypothetical protein
MIAFDEDSLYPLGLFFIGLGTVGWTTTLSVTTVAYLLCYIEDRIYK